MAVMHHVNDGLLPNITSRNCTNSYCFNYEQSNYYFPLFLNLTKKKINIGLIFGFITAFISVA